MTRWLDDEQQDAWRRFLHATSLLSERLDHGLSDRSDLSSTDYEILVHLSEAPERRLRMSQLASTVLVSKSRLTYRIDRLVAKGLIDRVDCPNDGRGTNALLTDEGFRQLEAAAPGHVDDVRRYLIDLIEPDEFEAFRNIFTRVEAALLADD
ncbi:MAG: MarR family transcriptional regulator [Acidimicrobiales bacterium]